MTRNKYTTPEQREEMIERFKRLGWRREEYCERLGLNIHTFNLWLSQDRYKNLSVTPKDQLDEAAS